MSFNQIEFFIVHDFRCLLIIYISLIFIETPMKQKKDVLIALINNKEDFRIAHRERWYRIPVQSAPRIVIEKRLRYLAFYQTKIFGDDAFKVQWYGEVKNISQVKRKELFPDLVSDPKAEKEYYKIEFGKLRRLPEPIVSRRHRRVLFIITTLSRLESAKELKDVSKRSAFEKKIESSTQI